MTDKKAKQLDEWEWSEDGEDGERRFGGFIHLLVWAKDPQLPGPGWSWKVMGYGNWGGLSNSREDAVREAENHLREWCRMTLASLGSGPTAEPSPPRT